MAPGMGNMMQQGTPGWGGGGAMGMNGGPGMGRGGMGGMAMNQGAWWIGIIAIAKVVGVRCGGWHDRDAAGRPPPPPPTLPFDVDIVTADGILYIRKRERLATMYCLCASTTRPTNGPECWIAVINDRRTTPANTTVVVRCPSYILDVGLAML